MVRTAAVILAAGQGTRMRSRLPKVLHRVVGRELVLWPVASARLLDVEDVVVVVGNGADEVREVVGDDVTYVHQAQRLGTGHAVLQAREALLAKSDAVLVLYGDMPALRWQTIERLLAIHDAKRPAITMLTVLSDDSMGFGRIVRNDADQVTAIVEEAVAIPEILAIKELNCGVYCFDADWLWRRLPDVPVTQPKGEYYLTDTVALAVEEGAAIEALVLDDVEEVQGINTRVHLARTEEILRKRINEDLMLAGVTLVDPATTYVHAGVTVGQDSVIYPNVHIEGNTVIGQDCQIGPNAMIRDTIIGDGCQVIASVLEEARMDDGANIGPFGHLRKGAHLGPGVHMGNFGEVKNSYLGPGTKMGHFSYLGDAQVGTDVNIGAGTITCNYDGQRKHATKLGNGVFVGSGSMLVAPLDVGDGVTIGAGSVVTHDLPDGTLAFGVPARPRQRLAKDIDCDDK